jgi:hypothetical protein
VRIAAGGVRLVVDELRTDVTKTRKDGTRGRLRVDYGDHRDPQAARTSLAFAPSSTSIAVYERARRRSGSSLSERYRIGCDRRWSLRAYIATGRRMTCR